MRKVGFIVVTLLLIACKQAPQNTFTFCRDFDAKGCVEPQATAIVFPLEKSVRTKTMRDFYNSLYFRGDRLAFEIKNADSRHEVTFKCLRGHFVIFESPLEKHELEYIELREKNVYGLVMLGSLLEKKFAGQKAERYTPPAPFAVTYAVFCGKEPLIRNTITVEMK